MPEFEQSKMQVINALYGAGGDVLMAAQQQGKTVGDMDRLDGLFDNVEDAATLLFGGLQNILKGAATDVGEHNTSSVELLDSSVRRFDNVPQSPAGDRAKASAEAYKDSIQGETESKERLGDVGEIASILETLKRAVAAKKELAAAIGSRAKALRDDGNQRSLRIKEDADNFK